MTAGWPGESRSWLGHRGGPRHGPVLLTGLRQAPTITGLLDETARLARSRYDRELRAQFPGMTYARCAVLIHLAQHKWFNQTALAQILDIRSTTLVRLLHRLEAAGFVERMPDPDDRRAHVLVLTARALPIIGRVHDLNRKIHDDLR
jgi:DNA-binding MarR family transcriptional regulator